MPNEETYILPIYAVTAFLSDTARLTT